MNYVPRILMILDIDGTVSRVYSEAEQEMNRELDRDAPYMPIDESVVDSLDHQSKRPGVEIGWLTSWARTQTDVDALVEGEQLRGRLKGVLVQWEGGAARGRRFRSLIAHLERETPDAVIWVDDDAPSGAQRRVRNHFGMPTLVVRPEPRTGITHGDVDRIRSFIVDRSADFDAEAHAARLDRDHGQTFSKLANR